MSSRQVAEIVEETVRRTVESMNPDVTPVKDVHDVELPIEDIQLTGEKVGKGIIQFMKILLE